MITMTPATVLGAKKGLTSPAQARSTLSATPPSRRRPLTVRPRGPSTQALASDKEGEGPPPPGPPPRPPTPPSSSLLAALEAALLPRARGDARDVALMATAVAGLVWASMGATRAYCALYAAAGLKPLGRSLVEAVVNGASGGGGGQFW